MNRLRSRPLPAVQLRDALNSAVEALPDGELLDRFARYADHSAFEVLVRRHGPMVFGVCRRMLVSSADADDAFQAAFLVLIRKASSLRRDRLGPWLYGVACRVAMKARAREARRAAFRTEATDMIPDPAAPVEIPDWLPILDAELNALPAKYRDPLVLCELQGATRAAAAKQLGVPEGTLSSRLARGRDLLRKRLLKHGTLLPAGGLSALFALSNVGRATAPAALLARTAELAKVATGAVPAGTVPVGAARLTDEVLKGMFLTKLRLASGAFALLALAAVGLSAAAPPAGAPGAPPDKGSTRAAVVPGGKRADKPAAENRPADKPRPVEGPDQKAVQGYWKLEKMELPPKLAADPEAAKQIALMTKHTWLLVEGDVWWLVTANGAVRHEVTLSPERNPKWIDSPVMRAAQVTITGIRGIYRLPDAGTLELCLCDGDSHVRPAEFVPDDDHSITICRFKRHALPEPPADRRTDRRPLLGSWEPRGAGAGETTPQSAVFTLNFAFLSGDNNSWSAYTYEVDTEKNPSWIDLNPVVAEALPGSSEKAAPIYGVFARRGPNDSALSLALGEGVKRVARPLEFVADKPNKVRVLNLTRADEKPAAGKGADLGRARELIAAGQYANAAFVLKRDLSNLDGVRLAEGVLMAAVCHNQLARAPDTKDPRDRDGHRLEALRLLVWANETLDAVERAGGPTVETKKLRARADWYRLQALTPPEVIAAAEPLLKKYHGTTEELIVLSLVHHAYSAKDETQKAAAALMRMEALFKELKDKPDAFPDTQGEYSLDYWGKNWFGRP